MTDYSFSPSFDGYLLSVAAFDEEKYNIFLTHVHLQCRDGHS